MNETEFGYPWDISFDHETQTDVVMIEHDGTDLYLTRSDLEELLDALRTA